MRMWMEVEVDGSGGGGGRWMGDAKKEDPQDGGEYQDLAKWSQKHHKDVND